MIAVSLAVALLSPAKVVGVELGLASNKVVALLGQPNYKTFPLTSEASWAVWPDHDVTIGFRNGKVTEVRAGKPSKLTTIPDVGSTREEVVKVLGEKVSTFAGAELFGTGEVSYIFKDGKVTSVALDALARSVYDMEKKAKASPGYKLRVLEASCLYTYDKKKPKPIFKATISGIVRNDREATETIRILGRWVNGKGEFIKAGETLVFGVKPGETRAFEITAYDLYVDRNEVDFTLQTSSAR